MIFSIRDSGVVAADARPRSVERSDQALRRGNEDCAEEVDLRCSLFASRC
jgi:hypothetical protein